MALDQSALLEVLEALKVAEVGDRVRAAAETIYQALIEAELAEVIGAAAHERSDARTNHRNGHRTRTLSTTAGDLELRIWSTKPLERLNKEVKRRTDIVGVFPNPEAAAPGRRSPGR